MVFTRRAYRRIRSATEVVVVVSFISIHPAIVDDITPSNSLSKVVNFDREEYKKNISIR